MTTMSELRDRIAAVLASVEVVLDGGDNLNETSTFLLADAVIRELGLRREGNKSRTVTNESGATYRVEGGHRYVTEWTTDD